MIGFTSAGGSKIHRVNLGTGTSFNVSNYPGYKKFTEDNFMLDATAVSCTAGYWWYNTNLNQEGNASGSSGITKSYNNSSGVLTIGGTSTSCSGTMGQGNFNGSASVSYKVILIY